MRVARADHSYLGWSLIAAISIEALVVATLSHKFVHDAPPAAGPVPIEAEIYEKPPDEPSHLTEDKPKVREVRKAEPVISKRVDVGHAATKADVEKAMTEQNQTEAAKPALVSHGPIVVSSGSPKLPDYLRDQNLKTSVLIEFTIGGDGSVEPHLIGSSGNEELDQLALHAARDWKFNPAVQNNQPIASKVRLRINFEVN